MRKSDAVTKCEYLLDSIDPPTWHRRGRERCAQQRAAAAAQDSRERQALRVRLVVCVCVLRVRLCSHAPVRVRNLCLGALAE